ncbi:sulfite exporter TauE/SafE family protein [Achromobacter sp. GG226]|uniref:sulfite exporter TauE/SafE family protein n=1 Tax=Verticiella alkaliphila TaxID=2779529 RepID=UPI001C0C4633|nr:sulfite exporter TauE/SafE family protein [Verticiella sp. GG226]MBU4611062.1 sulfite exporter TauE/SafE family protein [Verticiella sp. GG226]
MDVASVASLLALGLGCGFLAGLLGVGGGMVMAPLLAAVLAWQGVALDMQVHVAIATAMATILFTSLSSARAHSRRGAVRWHVVAAMVPGLILGGLLSGGAAFALLPAAWLALGFGLFVGYSALRMLTARPVAADRALPGALGLGAAGTGIGFISGLVGAGGGFLSVPFMTRRNVPLAHAIGTSAALGFPIAAANTVGYVWSGWHETTGQPGMFGFIAWPVLIVVSIASMLAAPVGAAMAHRLPVHRLKRAFAGMLFLLACYMLWKSYTAFVA